MTKDEAVKIFNRQRVRTHWDEEAEKWYFSIVDVVAILTDSADPNNYWKVLKSRLIKEGNKSVTNCNRLKMRSPKDGKYYKTDVADTFEQNQEIAKQGGEIAGTARRQIERKTGKSVVTAKNANGLLEEQAEKRRIR